MDEEIRMEDLADDELAELLAEEGTELSESEAVALKQLIEQLGGIENAMQAIEMLHQVERAA
jgi:hypothetical protein